MKLKVEYVSTDSLNTYENNVKIHDAAQIERIKESIKRFGFNDPIAVWKDNVIIEGHGRLIAAKELDIKKVPVIRLDGLTDDQRKAYAIIHNKLTMDTGFDFDLLQMELENNGLDLSVFGFEAYNDADLERNYIIENREYQAGEFDDDKFEYECPECGFRFNA